MQLIELLSEFLLELQFQNYSNKTIGLYRNSAGGLLTFYNHGRTFISFITL